MVSIIQLVSTADGLVKIRCAAVPRRLTSAAYASQSPLLARCQAAATLMWMPRVRAKTAPREGSAGHMIRRPCRGQCRVGLAKFG
jgi:hypothetical protein